MATPRPASAATASTNFARRAPNAWSAAPPASACTIAPRAAARAGRTIVKHRFGLGRGRLVAAALDRADTVLLELVVERAGLDAEQARGLGLHAAALVISALDQLAFQILEDLRQRHLAGRQRERVFGQSAANARGQRAHVDDLALGENERLLDEVLQLAHVPGPAVRAQPRERRVAQALD